MENITSIVNEKYANDNSTIKTKEIIGSDSVINVYTYGSRVYGCYTDNSDHDFVVIVKDDYEYFRDNIEIGNYHLNLYKQSIWENMIKENDIVAMECLFLSDKFILKENIKYTLGVDSINIRKSVSKVASNAYDKCRKKLTIEKDFNPYAAKKSLWHSIRVLLFGIQILKHGRIVEYSEANKYYEDIVLNEQNSWEYYKETWHEFLLGLRSEFRILTEEDWKNYKEEKRRM